MDMPSMPNAAAASDDSMDAIANTSNGTVGDSHTDAAVSILECTADHPNVDAAVNDVHAQQLDANNSDDVDAACTETRADTADTARESSDTISDIEHTTTLKSVAPTTYNDDQQQRESHAALTIQCAYRRRSASNAVARRRSHLRELTNPDVAAATITDLMCVLDAIELELDARQFASDDERAAFPFLCERLASWTDAVAAIRDRVLELPQRAQRVQALEDTAERVAHFQTLHDAMAEIHSDAVALRNSVVLLNSYFVERDVQRINAARATLERWKQHELCALADPRITKVVPLDDLDTIFSSVECALQRAMSVADFAAGTTTAAGKHFETWHIDVVAALACVREMEQRLAHKIHLLAVVRQAQTEKRECARMAIEDDESSQRAFRDRARERPASGYAQFVAQCRASWCQGLEKRDDDASNALAVEQAQREAAAHKLALVQQLYKHEHDRQTSMTLSIWEAVTDGLSADRVRAALVTETQRAQRRGETFVLRTARSDRGETLLQIACWCGHEHLVTFLLDEGASAHDVDSLCNRFSLLHDAARRGHDQVIRLLLEHGVRHDVVDSAGDTPLHWAARRNHYDAVQTLLGANVLCADPHLLDRILTTVRTKNGRGKTPMQVAKNASIRRVLQAFDDGRAPLFRHRRGAATTTGTHRRMTDLSHQH